MSVIMTQNSQKAYKGAHLVRLGWLLFLLFHLLPGSAWADGELAKEAEHASGQDGETSPIKINPTPLSGQMGHPVVMNSRYSGTRFFDFNKRSLYLYRGHITSDYVSLAWML